MEAIREQVLPPPHIFNNVSYCKQPLRKQIKLAANAATCVMNGARGPNTSWNYEYYLSTFAHIAIHIGWGLRLSLRELERAGRSVSM